MGGGGSRQAAKTVLGTEVKHERLSQWKGGLWLCSWSELLLLAPEDENSWWSCCLFSPSDEFPLMKPQVLVTH